MEHYVICILQVECACEYEHIQAVHDFSKLQQNC